MHKPAGSRPRFLGWFLLFLAAVAARPSSATDALLDRIKARAAENLSRLPDCTCTLTIERSRRDPRTGSFEPMDTVRLEVAMVEGKEQFGWPGAARIDEPDIVGLVRSGAIGSGAFGLMAQNIFFSPATVFNPSGDTQRSGRKTIRYDYRVPLSASGFNLKFPERDAVVGYHGSFEVDAKTLDLTALDFTAEEIPASLGRAAARGSIEYRLAYIGNAEFLLPHLAELTMTGPEGRERRNVTRFHDCRRYAGQSFISFVEPPPATSPPTRTGFPEVVLPPDVYIELSLETPIKESSAVGDPIRAKVAEPVKRRREILVPKGAVSIGRILRLDKRAGSYILQIGFESLDWEGGHADLAVRRNRTTLNLPHVAFGGVPRSRPVAGNRWDLEDAGVIVVNAPHLSLTAGTRITLRSTAEKH